MCPEFDDITDDFCEIRDFVLNDLKLIVKSPVGGNYTATLLVATACEVLGPLRFKNSGEKEFFREYMVPDKWKPVAHSIYDALRNGITHAFSTKAIIQANTERIELGISWSKKPHFEYDEETSTIFINVKDLAVSLSQALKSYEEELKSNSGLCNLFKKNRKKKRVVDVCSPTEREAWNKILGE